MPEQDLMEIKKAIEQAKVEESELVGQLTQLTKTLKEDFNCKNVDEAKRYLEELNSKIAEKEKALSSGIQELKSDLGW